MNPEDSIKCERIAKRIKGYKFMANVISVVNVYIVFLLYNWFITKNITLQDQDIVPQYYMIVLIMIVCILLLVEISKDYKKDIKKYNDLTKEEMETV